MPGKLIVTVQDTAAAQPAAGLRMQVFWVEPTGDVLLRTATTNAAGAADKPLIDSGRFSAGTYRLMLHAGDYFAGRDTDDGTRFFDLLPVNFLVVDASVDVRFRIDLSPSMYTVTRI